MEQILGQSGLPVLRIYPNSPENPLLAFLWDFGDFFTISLLNLTKINPKLKNSKVFTNRRPKFLEDLLGALAKKQVSDQVSRMLTACRK